MLFLCLLFYITYSETFKLPYPFLIKQEDLKCLTLLAIWHDIFFHFNFMSDIILSTLPSLEERLAAVEVELNDAREEYLSIACIPANAKARGLIKSKMNELMENRSLILEMIKERSVPEVQISPMSINSNLSAFIPAPINLPNNLPLFEGQAELSISNLRHFITKLEMCLHVVGMPVEKFPAILFTRTTGATSFWIKAHIIDRGLNWENAKSLFISHYAGALNEDAWHDRLLGMKIRRGESVRAYSDRFQEFASQGMNDANERLVVSRYLQGLPKHLSEAIAILRTWTKSEQLDLEETIQRVLAHCSASHITVPVPIEERVISHENNSKSSTSVCKFCSIAGHQEDSCFKKYPEKLEQFRKSMKEKTKGFKAIKVETTDDDIMAPIMVNEIEICAFIDTGACVSFMSESLADKLALSIKSCQEKFFMAIKGNPFTPKGKVKVNLAYGSKKVEAYVYVADI